MSPYLLFYFLNFKNPRRICNTKEFPRSGELNAKQRELEELQALAQRRLKGARANFAEGAKAAKEVRKDLEWTQKRVK